MRGILLVAWQELVVNLRRPTFIIMTLLIPALGLIALLAGSLFFPVYYTALSLVLNARRRPVHSPR